MKLKQIASNMTEIEFNQAVSPPYYVLFSYSTPVAGRSDVGVFKTANKYSATTTKHINKYFREEWGIDPLSVDEVDQAYIDGLVK